MLGSITEACSEGLPFCDELNGKLSPSWWDSPPIAASLHDASAGFTELYVLLYIYIYIYRDMIWPNLLFSVLFLCM